jgi:pimeloyl-ACP methyl ester carboxylesterase
LTKRFADTARPKTEVKEKMKGVYLMRKWFLLIPMLAVLAISTFASTSNTASAATVIEDYYKAQGSLAVSTGTATDGLGYTYHLWYPTNMTSGHAIISFGVGTGGTPTNYADTLDHLASWGFVVIANDNGTQGLGQYIVAGAQYMVLKNSDPASIFYNKLDTTKIGAFGHSQGAGGVLNAVLAQPTLFDGAVANALPNPSWWSTPVPSLTGWPTGVPLWYPARPRGRERRAQATTSSRKPATSTRATTPPGSGTPLRVTPTPAARSPALRLRCRRTRPDGRTGQQRTCRKSATIPLLRVVGEN